MEAGPRRPLIPLMLAVLALTGSPCSGTAQDAERTQRLVRVYERESRVLDLQLPRVVATLNVAPGTAIADIGAGSGLFSRPLARAVGKDGVVYAVEIDPGMLAHIQATANDRGIDNILTVLGDEADPMLPRRVDLVFMSDVLHQVGDRLAYLRTLRRYLAPSGRIAVIDLINNWPTRPHRHYGRADLDEMMRGLGYVTLESHDFIPGHFFVIYGVPRGS